MGYNKAYQQNYYQKHKGRIKARSKARLLAMSPSERSAYRCNAVLKNKKKHPELYLLRLAKKRADENGIEFRITVQDIEVPAVCPILGIVLEIGGHQDSSPSLDRIDNTKGYIPGNVEVISYRANRLKSDATPEELELLASYYRKNTPSIFR